MLKSALEKVIFFECRLDQLTSELARANAEIDRLKGDLAAAAQRELGLKQELAAAESRAGQARRERDDSNAAVEAAHRERERVLDKLIEAERIRMAGEQVEGIDLAAFIADLRSEVAARRGDGPVADATRAGYESPQQAADAFAAAGRLGITEKDRAALQAAARFETRSEETLFALSLRELSAAEPLARVRSAERLQALGARAALPAIAAALNAEQQPEVICAFLAVCGAAGETTVLPIVQARLVHDSVEVRLAALEAAQRLRDPTCLSRALDDESIRVRRRAAVLASGSAEAAGVLERAARDADPSVRRVAVLGLASLGGPRAEPVLLEALDDADVTVRRSAAKGLSRTFGAEVFAVADLDVARRRREIRRLATLPSAARRPHLPAPAPEAPLAEAEPAPEPAPAEEARAVADLQAEVLARVYGALRGQSDDDLVKSVRGAPGRVLEAATALVGQGRLVRRGQRFFVP